MTNFEIVRDALLKKHPEDAKRLQSADAYYICNRYMPNDRDRAFVARLIGLQSKCDMCIENDKENCTHKIYPLNFCRNNLIKWLQKGSEQ